jgi:hypothetical protein
METIEKTELKKIIYNLAKIEEKKRKIRKELDENKYTYVIVQDYYNKMSNEYKDLYIKIIVEFSRRSTLIYRFGQLFSQGFAHTYNPIKRRGYTDYVKLNEIMEFLDKNNIEYYITNIAPRKGRWGEQVHLKNFIKNEYKPS